MYNDFFGLKASPFELSPDPFFMFSSEKSQEALTAISGAIGRRKGFVVLTGEVGTGKTLILRCLFELWEREQIPFAYFIGPRLSTIDFLNYINFELGIEVAEPTKGNLLRALYGFLLAQFEKGLTTVLVIDEAHQVSRSVLEEIRLLTNFETAQKKLIQILLVGQPELDRKLDSVELRSLKQRIAVRCQLEPLRTDEIRGYIERRLELAGADQQASTIFPEATVNAIYKYSQGIPRLINNICDQALMAAYEQRVRVVPVQVIEQVAARFRLEPSPDVKAEESSSPPTDPTSDKLPQSGTPPNALTTKAPNSDAIIMYLDDDSARPPQTASPTKSTKPLESSPSGDFVPYTRKIKQQTIDKDKIREFLTEFDSQPRKAEPATVSFDLSDLSDALASANSAGQSHISVSSEDSASSPASNQTQLPLEAAAAAEQQSLVEQTAAPETEDKPEPARNVLTTSETEASEAQALEVLPIGAAMPVDPTPAAEDSSPSLESKEAAAAAAATATPQPWRHLSAEALRQESARLQEQLSSLFRTALATANDTQPSSSTSTVVKSAATDTKVARVSEAVSQLADISYNPGIAALRANHEAELCEIEELPTVAAVEAAEIGSAESSDPTSSEALTSEGVVEDDHLLSRIYNLRNKKGILTSAVAAGFLVLAAAGAQYLRRPSTPVQSAAAVVQPASVAAAASQSSSQNGAAGRGPIKGSGAPAAIAPGPKTQSATSPQANSGNVSGANADLLAYRQLAEPSSKKSILGQVHLVGPTVKRGAKSQDPNEAGVAPSIDAEIVQTMDGLDGGLAGTSGTDAAGSSAPVLVGGDVKPAKLLTSVPPLYPTFAKNQRVEGDVRVDAMVDVNGRVTAAKAVSGPTLLQQAAVDALRQWKYQPATLDGKPVPMRLTVTIQFRIH